MRNDEETIQKRYAKFKKFLALLKKNNFYIRWQEDETIYEILILPKIKKVDPKGDLPHTIKLYDAAFKEARKWMESIEHFQEYEWRQANYDVTDQAQYPEYFPPSDYIEDMEDELREIINNLALDVAFFSLQMAEKIISEHELPERKIKAPKNPAEKYYTKFRMRRDYLKNIKEHEMLLFLKEARKLFVKMALNNIKMDEDFKEFFMRAWSGDSIVLNSEYYKHFSLPEPIKSEFKSEADYQREERIDKKLDLLPIVVQDYNPFTNKILPKYWCLNEVERRIKFPDEIPIPDIDSLADMPIKDDEDEKRVGVGEINLNRYFQVIDKYSKNIGTYAPHYFKMYLLRRKALFSEKKLKKHPEDWLWKVGIDARKWARMKAKFLKMLPDDVKEEYPLLYYFFKPPKELTKEEKDRLSELFRQRRKRRVHEDEFKCKVLKEIKDREISLRKAALKYDIHHGTISKWKKQLREGGLKCNW